MYDSSVAATLVLTPTPQMYNPNDASGSVQAAIKNLANNTVFYFVIPVNIEVCFASNAPAMEVQALATAWKGSESTEVSTLVNGKI